MGSEGTQTGITSTVAPTARDLLAVAFASAPDPAILLDGDWVVVGWNRAAQHRYGWTSREVVGGLLAALVLTREQGTLRAALDAVMRGVVLPPFAVTLIAKEGQNVRAMVQLWPVTTDEGDVIAIAAQCDDRSVAAAERIAAERFRRIFAADVFGVCCGVHDRITEANTAFLDAIGSDIDGLREGRLALGTVFGDGSHHGPIVDAGGRDFEVRRSDGTAGHLFAAVMSYGTDAGWVGLTVDVTDRKAAEHAVAHLALHDPVTGLPNSRLLLDAVEQALSRANRRDRYVALLFCDVDHFKHVNDTHGHRVGDEVLRTVARRIESVLRGDDIVARVGGDEFVVVLQELPDTTEATRVAERTRVAIAEPLQLEDADGTTLRVTVSIGVAISDVAGADGELLLREADKAMYRAKQQGRDRIAFGNNPLQTRDTRSPGLTQ